MIAAAILRRGVLHPERPAIVDDWGVETYGELRQRVLGVASGLRTLGLQPGERVGLVLGNRRHHVEALLAASWLGVLAVPVDPQASELELRNLSQRFRLRHLLCEDSATTGEGHGELRREGLTMVTVDQVLSQASQPEPKPEPPVAPPPYPTGVLTLSLTSGSTGEPKAIVLTNEVMMHRFMAQLVEFGLGAEDRFLLTTPIHYGAGRSYTLNHLFVGACVYMHQKMPAHGILEEIERQRITTAFLVPTQLVRVLEHQTEKQYDTSSLRCLIVSGALLDSRTRAQVIKTITPNLYEVYASTEVGAISIVTPADRRLEGDELGLGRPLWNIEVRLADRQRGDVGEIACRGPGTAVGYLDEPRRRARWLRTGDVARVDAAGRLHWVGRSTDVIVTGGRKVHPSEVEEVIASHPSVRAVAVVGVPDRVWGEAVVAFVVNAAPLAADDLERLCRSRLAPYKVPKAFYLVPDLPTTASGKLDRRRLKRSLPGGDVPW